MRAHAAWRCSTDPAHPFVRDGCPRAPSCARACPSIVVRMWMLTGVCEQEGGRRVMLGESAAARMSD